MGIIQPIKIILVGLVLACKKSRIPSTSMIRLDNFLQQRSDKNIIIYRTVIREIIPEMKSEIRKVSDMYILILYSNFEFVKNIV